MFHAVVERDGRIRRRFGEQMTFGIYLALSRTIFLGLGFFDSGKIAAAIYAA